MEICIDKLFTHVKSTHAVVPDWSVACECLRIAGKVELISSLCVALLLPMRCIVSGCVNDLTLHCVSLALCCVRSVNRALEDAYSQFKLNMQAFRHLQHLCNLRNELVLIDKVLYTINVYIWQS